MPAPSDLVHETTSGTGTGNLTLTTVSGKRSFATAFGTGVSTNVFDYFISHRTLAEWERGTGHMSDATTLVRDTVLASSNAGAAVNFSAGTKDVTNDVPAAKQITTENIGANQGAGKASFLVHKGGTDQTGIADVTFTTVTFSTEVYDVGSYFAANAWTPPNGKVNLWFFCLLSGTFTTGNQISAIIRKNGSAIAQASGLASSVFGGGSLSIYVDDACNGTDVYDVQVYADVNSGTVTVSGNSIHTRFGGHWIS